MTPPMGSVDANGGCGFLGGGGFASATPFFDPTATAAAGGYHHSASSRCGWPAASPLDWQWTVPTQTSAIVDDFRPMAAFLGGYGVGAGTVGASAVSQMSAAEYASYFGSPFCGRFYFHFHLITRILHLFSKYKFTNRQICRFFDLVSVSNQTRLGFPSVCCGAGLWESTLRYIRSEISDSNLIFTKQKSTNTASAIIDIYVSVFIAHLLTFSFIFHGRSNRSISVRSKIHCFSRNSRHFDNIIFRAIKLIDN